MNARFRSLGIGLLGFLVAVAGPVGAQMPAPQFPKSVTLGVNPPGTAFYTVGGGLAKVVSGAAPFQMGLQPYSGASTFLPLLNGGELEFGLINAVDMGLAYQGPTRMKVGGRNPYPHSPNSRLAMRGSPLLVGLLVRKDSPIKSIHEVKGKRVTGEYPAQLGNWLLMFGGLASAGLTWEDVRVVPVPAVNDGVDALVQGRADLALHALNAAKVREADASVGVRHLSIDCSQEGKERLQKAVPGFYSRVSRAGSAAALVEDTCVVALDIYLITHKTLPEHVVFATVRAIWENMDNLPPFHPLFKEWTRQRAVDPGVTMPYHPGAVKFYREQRAWIPEMEQAQQRLLALNP